MVTCDYFTEIAIRKIVGLQMLGEEERSKTKYSKNTMYIIMG